MAAIGQLQPGQGGKRPLRLADAPAASPATAARGESRVALAVDRAVRSTDRGTVSGAARFTQGAIVGIWRGRATDPHNEVIDKLIAQLRDAHQEIRIQTMGFDVGDESARRLLDALAAKQKADPGFKVYIIYNHENGLFGHQLQDALIAHGVNAEVATYLGLPSRGVEHTKAFILDGRTGVFGSANIQNHPENNLYVAVQGPAAGTLGDEYAESWNRSHAWFSTAGGKVTPLDHPALPALPAAPPLPPGTWLDPMTFMGKEPSAWTNGHGYRNDSDQGMLAALDSAKQVIHIKTPNLNDPEVFKALQEAAERGVQVQIILPKGFNQNWSYLIVDGPNNDYAVQQWWATLPAAARDNVHIRWYSEDGKTMVKDHTKYVSVDGQWAYAGSQNLDRQSFLHSRESGFGFGDPAAVAQLDQAVFQPDWARAIPAQPTRPPLLSFARVNDAVLQSWLKAVDFVDTHLN